VTTETPIITLTTDFGPKGPFVGVMKGVILGHLPTARIVDLTHEIHAHWPAEGGFWLSRAHKYFPENTVHVAVVDPGVGTSRDIIATRYNQQIFVAPDNGILPHIIGDPAQSKVYQLSDAKRGELCSGEISATFHGRDMFAPLAAALAEGAIDVADIGPATTDIVPSLVEEPEVEHGRMRGAVVALDSFGNLISNIDATDLERMSSPLIQCGGQQLKLQDTYGRSQPGELLALINSFGVLEIARAQGSAADYLGLGLGAPITVIEK